MRLLWSSGLPSPTCTAVSMLGPVLRRALHTLGHSDCRSEDVGTCPLSLNVPLAKWLPRGRRHGFLCGASKGGIKANGAATAWRKGLVEHNEELSNNQSPLTMA